MRAALRRLLAIAQPVGLQAPSGVSVLAYHLVGGGTASQVDVDESEFEDQLAWLQEQVTVVSLPRALEAKTTELAVVLTFDDAFANFAEVALPMLERHQMPATLYVPTGFVDGRNPSPLRGADPPALSWSALRDLAQHPLVHIGSHGEAHRDLRTFTSGERLADLKRSRQRLEDQLGIEVADFCYPQAKWSRATERDVSRVYRSAAIAGGRVNRTIRPYRISRTPVRRDAAVSFARLVRSSINLEEAASDLVRRFKPGRT